MKRIVTVLAAMALALGAATSAFAADDGKNRRIVIENLSTTTINYLYASPVTSDDWEEDLLGDEVISSGASRGAVIDNGTNECNYDMKIVMSDGKEFIHRGVDVCSISWWIIGEVGDTMH